MADRCVVCHNDVAVQWLVPSPLHGMLRQDYPRLTCHNCHTDHRGPDAALTVMDAVRFPHALVGYPLTAHQRKTDGSAYVCDDCHAQSYTNFDQTICRTCHTQIEAAFMQTHSLDFGSNCLACHDGVDSYGHNFSHNEVSFQLSGKHAEVLCAECHVVAQSLADLKSTPQDCNSCHSTIDPHEGRYGFDCGTCHTSNGWTPASFDHNLSTFKLTGQHVDVACENCHHDHVFVGIPVDCFSCHQTQDAHNGSLGIDCASCHTTSGWIPVYVNHNLFAFILTGQHTTVACEDCHFKKVFLGTPMDCYSCHKNNDNHNGQFGSDCGSCHTTNAWKPATFDHNLSGFPLSGAHADLYCTQCHSSGVYGGLSTACVACHAEPSVHAGQFGTDCAQCHSTSDWNATFNHPGGCDGNCATHRGATCADCHTINYSTATCLKCHDSNNPHD